MFEDHSQKSLQGVSPNQLKQTMKSTNLDSVDQIGGFQSVKPENDKLSTESNDCNVADDNEEAIANIKAHGDYQTMRISDNHQEVIDKISLVE